MYLHHVLDEWFLRDVVPRMQGEAYIIRYADDFICAFQYESDARRFQSVLPKRLARFSLELAEEKTQLLRFGRFARDACQRRGEGSPGTFDFLGFTHYCGLSRANRFKLKRKTATKKFRAKLRELKHWFHSHLTAPVSDVWVTLNSKLRGHYQYYGINDNWPLLMVFRDHARWMAKRHLSRRSQHSYLNWSKLNAFLEQNPLASPKRLIDLIAMTRAGGSAV